MLSWIYKNSILYEAIEGYKKKREYIKGKNHADEEKSMLARCGSVSENLKIIEEFKKARSIYTLGSEFYNGYVNRWSTHGDNDAIEGICSIGIYRNHFYNLGWAGRVKAMKLTGWNNNRFDSLLNELETYYFDKIKTGMSQTYYKLWEK